MKIAHYLSRIHLVDGGVTRAVLDFCAVMVDHGHDVRLITWDAADAPLAWTTDAGPVPRVIAVDPPALPGGLYTPAALREVIRHFEGYDALHLHTPWDRVNVQLAHAARLGGTPAFLTPHGMLDDWSMAQRGLKKRLFLALGGRRMLEGVSAVHCTAQAELDQARKWFPLGRGVVIPYMLDLTQYRELPGPQPALEAFPEANCREPVVLFLSRLHLKKGVEILIEAIACLREQGLSVRALIAGSAEKGDDYDQQLTKLVERLRLNDCIFFIGFVSGVEKVSLYERADIFVLPTSQENFGIVLTEALVCRTPAITTRGTDIWRELDSSGGAMIVDQTAEAVASAIRELLSDKARRREMGQKGRAWVLGAFDPDAIVPRFEQMYAVKRSS